MHLSSRCNIKEKLEDQVTSVDETYFYIASTDPESDIYLDDIKVEIWTRDRGWVNTANMRIQEFRQMKVVLDIKTEGAHHVELKMVKNAFPFGGMIDSWMPAEMDNYTQFFDIFNYGVLRNEMKWYHNEKNEHEFDYEWADHFMNLFDQHDVPLRGHTVFWSVDHFVLDWVALKAQTDLAGLEVDVFDRVSQHNHNLMS